MSKFIDPTRAIGNPTKTTITDPMEDDDEKTVTSGGSGKNAPKFTEFNLKWCFSATTDSNQAKAKLHDILSTIMEAEKEEVTIIDHKAEEYEYDPTQTDENRLQMLKKGKFPTHKATSKGERQMNRWYITHTIRSNLSLTTIKTDFRVAAKLPLTPP